MNAKMSWIAVLAAVAVLIPQPAYAQAVSDAGTAADDYSIFYSPPARVDALFAAFLDVMPLQTREDALAAFQAMWDQSAAENGGTPEVYYWNAHASLNYSVSEGDIMPLEAEFGGMPEYWQLRYYLSLAEPPERILLLQKAIGAAPDDAVSLYIYWKELAGDWGPYHNLWMKCESEGAESLTPEELSIYCNWPQLPAGEVERVARMDGRNAMMYYWTAQLYARLGEYEHVLELLELGNNCPHNVEVHAFPMSYVYARPGELQDIVGADRVGCLASLKMRLDAYPIPNYNKLKDMVKEMCVAANLNGDVNALNAVHRYTCRFGQTRNARLIQRLIANVLAGVLADHVVSLWDPMDPEDARGFNILCHKRGMVKGMLEGSKLSSKYYSDSYPDGWPPSFAYLNEPLEPEKLVRLFSQGPVNEDFEINVLGKSIAGIFEDMEAFDYTDPAAFRGH